MTTHDDHTGACAVNQQPRLLASPLDPKSVLVLDERTVDGDVIISPRGEIDMAGAPLLWDRLSAAIPEVKERLVIDLSQTTFLDSTALSVFIRAQRHLRQGGVELVLRGPSQSARKVLSITALDQIMTIENEPSQASQPVQ